MQRDCLQEMLRWKDGRKPLYLKEYNPPLAIKSSLKNYSDSGLVHSLPLYALGLSIEEI